MPILLFYSQSVLTTETRLICVCNVDETIVTPLDDGATEHI